MDDSRLICLIKALGDVARVVVGIKLIARLAKIWRRRIKRSESEEP